MNLGVAKITSMSYEQQSGILKLSGFGFINKLSMTCSTNVRKSLILSNGSKTFYLPALTILTPEVTEQYSNYQTNIDYSGFSTRLDLLTINNQAPLIAGQWKLSLYLIVDDIECEIPLTIDEGEQALVGDVRLKDSVIQKFEMRTVKEQVVLTISSLSEKVQLPNIQVQKVSKVKQKLFQSIYNVFKYGCGVKKNQVVFLSDSRTSFTGNFEFVYNELSKDRQYKIKSLLKARINEKKSVGEFLRLFYYLATSKYIVLDDYYPLIYRFRLKKEIEVIQLWHATGAFKTFGFTRLGKKGGPSIKSPNHKNYTKAIVSSNHIRKHYAEAFGIALENVIATGVPRTDIFFDEVYQKNTVTSLYEKYPQLKDKKVITFAPTFRGKGQKTAHYDFDKLDFEALKTHFGDDYIFIMKIHPFVKKIPDFKQYEGFILDLSYEREINDLLFITDILITDYSSVCFEFALLNRPMIFFAYDLEKYIASRDFYYPFKSFVPGPIVKTTEELIDVIGKGDFDQEKLEQFRTKFFDDFDGKSTQRVIEQLFKNN